MSKQHLFDSYAEYVEAQRTVTLRKLGRGTCFTTQAVIDAIYQEYLKCSLCGKTGICHGVQKGGELDLFEQTFGGQWIGTDIVAEACDGKRIICHDFQTVKNEWIGAIDLIYSNALDHARNPWVAVKAWLSCLSERGRLFVEWTPWHDRLSRSGYKSDCYAASHHEYYALLNQAGRVERTIEVQEDGWSRFIFMVR